MASIEQLEEEINKIKERNKRVEAEKAWETSWTRKITICILTYLVISSFFLFADISDPFINSIVPTIGFILSTISVPFVKKLWLKQLLKS